MEHGYEFYQVLGLYLQMLLGHKNNIWYWIIIICYLECTHGCSVCSGSGLARCNGCSVGYFYAGQNTCKG